MKNKNKKKSFGGAKLGVVIIILLVIGCVFSGAELSKVNLEVEVLKIDIKKQEDKNESMVMKINELSSLDNIKSVIEDMGLAFNNDNIVVIE